MPYVDRQTRELLDDEIAALAARVNELSDGRAGAINYAVTRLLVLTLLGDGLRYEKINQAIGVLECAKLELYRRLAAPYEDEKAEQTGDVYG